MYIVTPSQNDVVVVVDPILDDKTSAVDSSPPWLDICFPSETNKESASCTVDTAVITMTLSDSVSSKM